MAAVDAAVDTAVDNTVDDTVGPSEAHRAAARAGVLGRLWRALWRERLPGVLDRQVRLGQASLLLADGRALAAPLTVTEFLGAGDPGFAVEMLDTNGAIRPIADPVALFTELRLPGPRVAEVTAELAASVSNLARALSVEQDHRDTLADSVAGAGGVLRWAGRRAVEEPGFDPLVFFEQAIVDGHPGHPCCHNRTGLSASDLRAYAPEYRPGVSLPVVAVRRDRHTGHGDLNLLLRTEHPAVAAAADASLTDPERYALLPVHPWQLAHVLEHRYADAFADGSLVVLPGVTIPAHPLLSLRTLVPAGVLPASHLKTALSVRLTGAVRIVSPAAVHNGPVLSALLTAVLRREPGLAGQLWILREPASAAYVDPDRGPSRSLAVLAREPVRRYLGAEEIALPAAALSARSPSGQPVVLDAMKQAGADAASWFAAYCRVVLPPMLTLLCRWGVGLEAHGQNTVVVLRGGWPMRILYRDLGGVRIDPRRLAERGLEPPELRGDLLTDDPVAPRTTLYATLVNNQLAALAATLTRHAGADHDALWASAAAAARAAFATLAESGAGDAAGQGCADARAFFGDTLPVKAMLSMRLAEDSLACRWAELPNPMAGLR